MDHGDDWQEEVLPEMRKGLSQLAAGEDDDAKELSIQDSVIVASVASIVGKDAERVKRLFVSSAVFGEGTVLVSFAKLLLVIDCSILSRSTGSLCSLCDAMGRCGKSISASKEQQRSEASDHYQRSEEDGWSASATQLVLGTGAGLDSASRYRCVLVSFVTSL